jgi:uncharacterized protein (DUF2249 family)
LTRIKATAGDPTKNAPIGLANASQNADPPLRASSIDGTPETMADAIELDVRGLEPPEPMVRIVAALDALTAGGSVRVKIDRQPLPLYRMLERNGYVYEERPGDDSVFEITIRLREGT